ncbi:hypothetical protein ACQKB2_17870 [Mycobacterium tuberculosis]
MLNSGVDISGMFNVSTRLRAGGDLGFGNLGNHVSGSMARWRC